MTRNDGIQELQQWLKSIEPIPVLLSEEEIRAMEQEQEFWARASEPPEGGFVFDLFPGSGL